MSELVDLISDGADFLQELKPILTGIAILGTMVALMGTDDTLPEADVSSYESKALKQQAEIISDLEREKKNLEESQNKKKQQQMQVEDWLKQTEELIKEICQYRYKLFVPGNVEDIQSAIAQAKDFLKKGAGQAAFSEAYDAWQMAEMTKSRLIDFELEWETEYENFVKAGIRAEMLFNQCAAWEVHVRTDEGEETVEINVDYWTRGRLREIYDKVPGQELPRECRTEEIRQKIAETEEMIGQMQRLPEAAAQAFLDSQMRAEQCETVYRALIKRGWTLENDRAYGYEKNDNRNNVILQMQNAVQDRVSLIFEGHGSFRVSARFRDANNRDFQKHLSDLLRRALTEDGFTLTDIQILTA